MLGVQVLVTVSNVSASKCIRRELRLTLAWPAHEVQTRCHGWRLALRPLDLIDDEVPRIPHAHEQEHRRTGSEESESGAEPDSRRSYANSGIADVGQDHVPKQVVETEVALT